MYNIFQVQNLQKVDYLDRDFNHLELSEESQFFAVLVVDGA